MSRLASIVNRKFIAGVACGAALVLALRWVIKETPIADWMVAPLLLSDTSGPAGAIVVLGAGVVGECTPNLNGVRRVILGARLFRAGRAPSMLITGGLGEGHCPVAVAMAQLAREIGVPESGLQIEDTARSTRENGVRSAPLLASRGIHRVVVVTDRIHMRRAAGAFTQLGFEVERASVPIYEGHINNIDMLAAGLRESAALAYYRLRGWLGPITDPQVVHAASQQGKTMQRTHPEGPVVVFGASYAAGWDLSRFKNAPVVNLGVAGQQSFEMLERFERDVVPLKPRAVVIWGFINDIFRSKDINATLDRVRTSYTEMIALARKHGIEPILATEVTIRPGDSIKETVASWVGWAMGKVSYQDRINGHIIAVNRWLMEVANREGLMLLDIHSATSDSQGRRRREFITEDGSHIPPAGYVAITAYAAPILEEHVRVR